MINNLKNKRGILIKFLKKEKEKEANH